MPTVKQKIAAKIAVESLVDGKAKTKGQIVKEAGYPPSMQISPHIVFNSPGFKQALAEFSKALCIDKDSRLLKLSKMFWESDSAQDVAKLNVEISKMLGDYAPEQREIKDLRTNRESLFKPE